MAVGNLTIKKPWTNDVYATMYVSYQDYSGVWKGLLIKPLEKTCDMFFSAKGMFANQRKRFSNVEDGCPAKPGSYEVGPAYVNRYRKDWEPDLKFWIPPYLLEADNWKAYGKYFYKNDPEKIIGELSAEFRLLNERMSQ